MWEKCVTNSYYCRFGCWLEREHGYFQGQGSRVWEMAGAMQVSSSFQEWISAHEVFHICGKWVLWGMNLATRIWNLLSFMKENLHVPFMYLVLDITGVRFCEQCQDIGFSFFIWKTGRAKVLSGFCYQVEQVCENGSSLWAPVSVWVQTGDKDHTVIWKGNVKV